MEKDIWGGSWSPEIESRVANSIWEEKYRVSFELIDSPEERISFLKELIEKTEEEREKLKKEYPVMSPEESEALIEGDRSVDLIYFKRDKEGFVDQLNKDIVSKNLPTKEKQIRHHLLDLINKYQPADEKREQGKVVESRVRGLKAFNEILFAKLNKARFNLKIEQQSENRTISNQPNRYDSITKNRPLQEYRQLIVNLLVEDWHKNDCSWPNGLNRRIWNQLKNLKNEGEQIIEGFNDDYVNFTDDNGGTISIHKGDSWNQALRSLKPYAKKELSQY